MFICVHGLSYTGKVHSKIKKIYCMNCVKK